MNDWQLRPRRAAWAIEEFGTDEKIYVPKNESGLRYCPQCCQGRYVTRNITVPFLWFWTKKEVAQQWVNAPQPMSYTYKNKIYCGSCKHLLAEWLGCSLKQQAKRKKNNKR